MKAMTRAGAAWMAAFIWGAISAFQLSAHTLPISYLTVVPGATHVHMELTINPFELTGSSELDLNKNGIIESAELASADKALTTKLLQHLKLKADGRIITAETAGLSSEPTSHHLTIRAHFPLSDPGATLTIESQLNSLTSPSHLTELTFGTEGRQQLARLDSQTSTAVFPSAARRESRLAQATPSTNRDQASVTFLVILCLAAIPLIGVFVTLLLFAPRHLREEPAHH